MGKIGKKGFAEGWQHQSKKISDKMAGKREKSASQDVRNASRTMEKVKLAAARKTADQSKAAETNLKNRVETPKNRPQAFERARPETQDRAARQAGHSQSAEFNRNKQDAQNLKKLQSRQAFTKTENKPAMEKAVVAKPMTDQPNLTKRNLKQPTEKLAQNAQHAAQRNEAREKVAKPIVDMASKGKETQKKPDAKGPQQTKAPEAPLRDAKETAKIPAAPVAKPLDAKRKADRPEDSRKKEVKRDENGRSSALSKSEGKEASRDLGSLLGGFGGGDDSGNLGGDPDIASAEGVGEGKTTDGKAKDKLPETDPTFKVYSEFDESNPGVEMVKSKAQVFSRLVEKKTKLAEIAKLDEELDEKLIDTMRQSFEQAPLSKRIIGELSEEYKEELNLARFLGSVYGGVCG